jgi:hypothetical protein
MRKENHKSKIPPHLWWAILAVYMAAIILLHRRGNEAAGKLIGLMGMEPYLWTARIGAMVGIALIFLWLGRRLLKTPQRIAEVAIFTGIAAVLDLSLISVPIERIHYLQYTVLAWLAWKAIGTELPAVLVAGVAGAVDEAYQFWVLYGNDPVVYFDWNDIVLNLLGGLIFVFVFLPREPLRNIPVKGVVAAMLAWVGAVGLLLSVWNPDPYLIRNDPYGGGSSFWITSGINTNYHVMNTWEGLVSLGILLIATFVITPGWRNWQTHRT